MPQKAILKSCNIWRGKKKHLFSSAYKHLNLFPPELLHLKAISQKMAAQAVFISVAAYSNPADKQQPLQLKNKKTN